MLRRLVIIFLGIILLLSILASSACESAPKGSGEWYFARAYQYAVNGDYQDAVINYTDAIKVEPLL